MLEENTLLSGSEKQVGSRNRRLNKTLIRKRKTAFFTAILFQSLAPTQPFVDVGKPYGTAF